MLTPAASFFLEHLPTVGTGRRLPISVGLYPGATAGGWRISETQWRPERFQGYGRLFPWGLMVSSGVMGKWDILEDLKK